MSHTSNTLSPFILAFGFGSPAMLAWLAAVAAPILIHLWNRRRYRETPWAAMEYLLAALKSSARRVRIEHWIILAVRVLLVGSVAVAVAQPYLERAGAPWARGERALKILVIDGSYSMAYRPDETSLFDRARQVARQIVETSPQGDAFLLVLMAAPPIVVVATPALEPRHFISEIEALKLTHGGGDLTATVAEIERLIPQSKKMGVSRVEVLFLTDLGRTSWGQEGADSRVEAEFRERVERLARAATLTVVDLGQSGEENLAITRLSTRQPLATLASNVEFEVAARNFGALARDKQSLELVVDGRSVKRATVDLPSAGEATANFEYRFESPGDHVVEARLTPDRLELDNHRWLSMSVRSSLRVLCVDGKPAGAGVPGATDFLTIALDPRDDPNQPPVVETEVISDSQLLDRDLSLYDCVFLCNVGQFTPSEARALSSYLNAGGGLVFFLGDQTSSDRYNREIGPGSENRLLPTRIGKLTPSSPTSYRFDPLAYRHSLVSIFKGREQAGLLTTPVSRYFRLEPPREPTANVALAFEGGDPAIVEERIGQGRSIVVAIDGSLSSIDPATKQPWSTFAVWPSYLPIVQEMLALSVGGRVAVRNREVGQPIGEGTPTATARQPMTLYTPDGRQEIRPTVDKEGSSWTYRDTWRSGVYRAEFGPPLAREENFAVNVDTVESNLARIDPASLPRGFTTDDRTAVETPGATVVQRGGLSHWLLSAVLGLLLLESFLACRLGHAT